MIFEENKVKEIYFDKYEGIQSEISQVTRFVENTDLSMTYLGKRGQTRKSVIRAEESFPISGQGYRVGKLADKTNCNILIDTGASQSYMSKSFYMQSKILHALPKFVPTTQRIQVGNGQYVAVLFVILDIIEIHGHLFEVFTLVSEIHENLVLVLGMKNAYELEGIVDMRDSSFKFLYFYMQSKILHALPKFVPTTQRIQVGNGQYVAVLFVILDIIEIHGHLFEVFTLVSEIHDNVDLVLGMKNAYELEGIVDMRDSSFKFLNRSIPFFSKEQTIVKPKEKKFVKIEDPFIYEISGHAIVKMIDNEG